ncbi:Lipase [Macleaya cordata]|uniref:Lipase n=1 Tax=Macleaya cordata TaxID=56857 RepID=A0A200RDM7_MACCD|nr:Lipase [Macleaya cordata]
MESVRVLVSWFLVLWVLGVGDKVVVMGVPPCNYPAIYNFGDSNSDTGGISAAFIPIPPPNGETFFGRPSGRVCDGRLVIDFMAEHLGLPYLSPYLDSIGTNFKHGANFATGGSTIRPQNGTFFDSGVSPFPLNVQLWQFDQFKARTGELYKQAKNHSDRNNFPKPEDFSKAIYTIDIGQNDLAFGFQKMSHAQVLATIPDILDQFSIAVHKLYQQGAKTFWIHNTGPLGCLPLTRAYFFGSGPGFYDQNGCVKSHNDVAVEFNRQLKERVIGLRAQLPHAALTYVDVYAAKYELISNTRTHGFVEPMKICCGHHEGYHVWCGQKMNINGTEVYGGSCGNPATYVSWDGTHYSHAANHWIANHILNGALSDPPVPITEACYKHH